MEFIHSSLQCWFKNHKIPNRSPLSDESVTTKQQTQIGWRQLFNGQISTPWDKTQDDDLVKIKLKTTKTN
eukprot:12540579-Ditylum_brightwellii.AAC.1